MRKIEPKSFGLNLPLQVKKEVRKILPMCTQTMFFQFILHGYGAVHKRRLQSGGCPVQIFCGQEGKGLSLQMRTSVLFGVKNLDF